MDEEGRQLTLVAGYRLAGSRRYLVLRARYDLADGEIVRDRRGAIPVFASPEAARAFGERLFPSMTSMDVNDGDSSLQQHVQDSSTSEALDEHDFDAGMDWVRSPREPADNAQDLLAAWSLLGLAGTAPAPDPEHLMGVDQFPFAARPGPSSTESELLAFTAWKLRSVVRENQKRAATNGASRSLGALEKSVGWNEEDTERLASVLDAGITAFEFLTTQDIASVERDLKLSSQSAHPDDQAAEREESAD